LNGLPSVPRDATIPEHDGPRIVCVARPEDLVEPGRIPADDHEARGRRCHVPFSDSRHRAMERRSRIACYAGPFLTQAGLRTSRVTSRQPIMVKD
jgi:hypothetical protein